MQTDRQTHTHTNADTWTLRQRLAGKMTNGVGRAQHSTLLSDDLKNSPATDLFDMTAFQTSEDPSLLFLS